jgi:hypothetical protein
LPIRNLFNTTKPDLIKSNFVNKKSNSRRNERMRANRLIVFATAAVVFITLVVISREAQVRNALKNTGSQLYEKLRTTAPTWELPLDEEGSSVVVEHNAAPAQVVSHRIGMLSMLIGKDNPSFERALKTHMYHGELQGYETSVLRAMAVDMMYNKPMFILNVLMNEMGKPFHQRLEWLL